MEPNEVVHHINFDKQDNSPDNLIICDRELHRWYHGNLETFIADLLQKGVVQFDPIKGYCLLERSDTDDQNAY